MLDRVIIKPAKNIKHHFKTAKQTIEYYDQNGQLMSTADGELRDRYPNTFTATRPKWSASKRRWNIEMDEDELNKLVERCKFQHERGSKKGDLITRADIHDEQDPFFCHSRLKIVSQEGQTSLMKDNPKDKIYLESILKDPKYSTRANGMLAGNVKYIISDEQGDRQFELNKLNSEIDAIIKFEGLVHDKKVTIASALGFRAADLKDPDSLRLSMNAFIKSNTRNEDGLFNRDILLKLLEEDNSVLSIKSLIGQAKNASVIRFDKGKGYMYNGNYVANSEKEMIAFLEDPNNKDSLNKIMEAVKEKS